MSTTSVSHAQPPHPASQIHVEAASAPPAALSTASTLTVAHVPEDSSGSFCENIINFFRSIFDKILQLLSKITDLAPSHRSEPPEPTTHMARIEVLYTVFRTAVRSSIPPIPTNEQLPRLLDYFRQLTDRVDQAETFSHIQRAANTTDAIVHAFFDILPPPIQDGIKYNIVQNYVRFRNEHSMTLDRPVIEMGQYTVDNEIRTVHMSAGVVNFILKLRADARAQTTGSATMTETNRLEMFYDAFRGTDSVGTYPIPTPDRLVELIARFREISNTVDKVETFFHIQRAVNATAPITRSFFDALPAHVQDGIKYQIIQNFIRFNNEHQLSLLSTPEARTSDLGQRTVDQEIRTATMSAGIVNYLAALRRN